MCGIVGCWMGASRLDPARVSAVERATDSLTHRGPDDHGLWTDFSRGVALGHRRLSILDLSPGGAQPMQSMSGDSVVVFNGEIYNHVEIRDRLTSRGVSLRGRSDTEVLLAAYEADGPDFVDHLRGMFALAIWDRREDRLVLARDRVGKKPLYYAIVDGGIVFASEIGAVLELLPPGQTTTDEEALDEYLSHGAILGQKTIYRHVRRLLPAHRAVLDTPERLESSRYWNVEWGRHRSVGFHEAVDETERLLAESVKLRLRADVPVGVLLSVKWRDSSVGLITFLGPWLPAIS